MAFSPGDYDIIEEIGQGSFGSIYKARQKSLGRVVAFKILSSHRTQKQSEILRFRREAEAMAVLTHDNIISVYDYTYYNNNYYIIMEFIDGINFNNALQNSIPGDLSLLIIEKVISGLKIAHSQKIIHRDIKPSNILLGKQGQVKLADFGLATFQPDVTKHSSSTAVLGTFCYMAPEAMVTPKEVDERVDIFSLGCILYQILTQKLPFPGATIGEVSYKVINKEPELVPVHSSLKDLLDITIHSLNKNREERPNLDDIHKVVRDSIKDKYHTVQEELLKFIKNGKPQKFKNSENIKLTTKKNTNNFAYYKWLIAIILIVLLAIVFFPRIILFFPSKQIPLPDLPKLNESSPLSSHSTISKNSESNKISINDPKPLTGNSLEQVKGTLKLMGILKEDTIIINSKRMKGEVKHGTQQFPLNPGYYKIVIRGKNKRIFSRELKIETNQVIELDVLNN